MCFYHLLITEKSILMVGLTPHPLTGCYLLILCSINYTPFNNFCSSSLPPNLYPGYIFKGYPLGGEGVYIRLSYGRKFEGKKMNTLSPLLPPVHKSCSKSFYLSKSRRPVNKNVCSPFLFSFVM